MNIGIKGVQDTGKTSLAVKHVAWLLKYGDYKPSEVFSTVEIRISGCKFMYVDRALHHLETQIADKRMHEITVLDEADGYLSHRNWENKDQLNRLVGLWQDMKLFNFLIWTAHMGKGVDLLLRDVTQVHILPWLDREHDCTYATVINCLFMRVLKVCYRHTSRVYPLYDRHQPIYYNGAPHRV